MHNNIRGKTTSIGLAHPLRLHIIHHPRIYTTVSDGAGPGAANTQLELCGWAGELGRKTDKTQLLVSSLIDSLMSKTRLTEGMVKVIQYTEWTDQRRADQPQTVAR